MPRKKRLFFDAESFELKAAASDDQNVRPFEMVAYNGGRLRVSRFPGGVVVDLNGVTVKASSDGTLPITLDHKDDQRVGHSEDWNVDLKAGRITLNGLTSAESQSRDEVLKSHRNGFRFQASIEGFTNGREFVKRGRSVRVNGRTFEGPVIVARKFTLRAVSFVSAGGDEENQVRLAASEGVVDMDPKYAEWLADLGLTEEDSTDKLKAKYESELKASAEKDSTTATAVDSDDDVSLRARIKKIHEEEQELAEERRLTRIQHETELEKICGDHRDLFASALKENWTTTKAELEVLRRGREVATPAIHVNDGDSIGSEVLEAALCRSNGDNPEDFGFDKKTLESMDKNVKGGYGLHALMHDVIRASGSYYQPGVYDKEFIRASYEADQKLVANAGFSTISLTGTLSNLANKYLLRSYNSIDGVIRKLAATRPTNDFKQMTGYRLNALGDLLPLGPDGEIKHTEVGEETYSNKIETRARMMAMTREMQINDDLGAFLQIPQAFGRSAARTEEKTGWQTLQAAIAAANFFTAGNGNLIPTGANAPLSSAGLTEAKKLFAEQIENGADGPEFVMTQGKFLITAPAIADVADNLMNDRTFVVQDHDTASTASSLVPSRNPHRGAYEPDNSAYFGAAGFGTDTQWMVVADPADIAFMEFAHLRGQSRPVFESAQADFNVLGIQWRIYRDFGWAMQDPHGAVYSGGQAS